MIGRELHSNYGSIKSSDLNTEKTHCCNEFIQIQHVPINLRRVLGIKMSSWLFWFYIMFYIFYLMFGAIVFSLIEQPLEIQLRNDLKMAKTRFLIDHPCVADEALENLISEVVAASNRGVSAANNVSSTPNWSFGQSLFFSSTVITTIGYGHVTPLSQEGKIFCMIYALFGIPLTLVLLTALVERLLVPSTWLLQGLNSRLGHLYQPFNIQLLHLFIIVLILTTLFLCFPASIFAFIEPEWDYLDSFYYCFISLTTIGLGDYIPGDSPNQLYRPVYKVATTIYLLIGLTFMMLTLTIFYEIPQLNLGTLFAIQSDYGHSELEKVRLASNLHSNLRDTYGSSTSAIIVNGGGSRNTIATTTDALNNSHRAVVRVRSRRDDSPSPEDTTPVHAKDMLVH